MYKKNIIATTSITVNASEEGETIESKMERVLSNNEPIEDGAPIIYTERKDGVLPEYNPRTDRFEVAIDGMNQVTSSHIAKREEALKAREEGKKDGGAESTQDQAE